MTPFWRREKPLHERLAERGGLDLGGRGTPAPHDVRPPLLDAGIHGHHRPREWDAVRAVDADAPGDVLVFVVLDDAVLGEEGADPPAELADAFEGALEPPYRVQAVRRGARRWAVAARRIRVERLEADGDELELALVAGERTGPHVPALEALLTGDGVVRAERLDGDLWEVEVASL